tara:strand:+ start:1261 stop:3564 length:2304 start_codon:yes stop_codon:yes gene_type:complete
MKNIFCIVLLVSILPAREIYKQVRVYIESENTISILQTAGMDVDHSYRKADKWIEFAVSESNIYLLDKTQLSYDIIHENLEDFYVSRLDNEYESRDFELGSMGGYYTFAEIEEQLDKLYTNHPSLITEKVSLGYTLEGRDVWMVKISDNPSIDEDEPEILYTGLHHAREPMSYMNLFYFMDWLTENYGTDPEATALVNSRELYFIPAVNPDGLIYNQSIAPNGGGMQRKNRRESCFSGTDGVDLNRNYSFMWGYDNSGSSPDGCQETYRGTSPFSEPETEIVRDFVEAHDFKIALNYHSYGNLFIHPYGYDPNLDLPEYDHEIFIEYGEAMTQYNNYLLGTGIETVGYTVNGEACDWMYGEHGIYAYTPEVGASSDGFWPATIRIIPLAEENLFPNQYAAWAVGANYNIDFSIEEGPYSSGNTYSTNLSIYNSGLGDSNGSLTLSIMSSDNYLYFDTETVEVGSLDSRESIDLGDILTFEILPTAPNGIMTELSISVTDEDGYEHVTNFDIIIGESISLDFYDFESAGSWMVGADGDNATAGIWELGIPIATSFDGNQAQPGYDHSESGEQCFITGASTSPGSVGFDDVDGGKTTLLSPIYNLSEYNEALVTYWRWYTNDVGDNPGTDHWQVDISSNGGQTWNVLEYTNQSQAEWIQKNFILSAMDIELTDQVQLRFIAEDIVNPGDSGSGGSIIEAALDDFTISIFEEDSSSLYGDLNQDGSINVLDVVALVNIVLTGEYFINADINMDESCNVLDIVALVNMILS